MKKILKGYLNRINENIANRVVKKNSDHQELLTDKIAFRAASETILNSQTIGKKPNEIFQGISDDFWFWLNTEGVRKNSYLKQYLPKMPDDYTQEMYTGAKGDATLEEGFSYYKIFKEQYAKYRGNLSEASGVLDYGCGWGRIIRFFLKDADPSKIWGCDPVPDMIKICKEQNTWCNFESIQTNPPTEFHDNQFDLIYSYSVFSHLSEDMHLSILKEVRRILKPGGIYMTTTRNRGFIQLCADLKKRQDLETMNPGPASSAQAFPDAEKSFAVFDRGDYCHHSFNDVNWPYWGETAIPKKYVQDHWTRDFTLLDFLDLDRQNVIIVQKPQ